LAHPLNDRAHGISAVLLPSIDLERAALDLVAVLEGLVDSRFEILLVDSEPELALNLQARGLPVRVVDDATHAARYDLIFAAVQDGQFDVRELNHLMDAIDDGADVAAGYRPGRMDALVRAFQRWGWRLDVDCAFVLVRLCVWRSLQKSCCAELVAAARRSGHRVTEVPVSHRRPTIGTAVAA
jgi:hypothetical protein